MIDFKKAIIQQLKRNDGRKIIVLSEGYLGQFILRDMKELGVKVERYIEHKSFFILEEKNIVEIVSKKYFLFIALYSGHKEIIEMIQGRGLTYLEDFIATNISVYVDELDLIDPLLGYSRTENEYPGVVRVCNHRKIPGGGYKIFVLGNSTSEESLGGIRSWAYFLKKELLSCGISCEVYNAAIAGYNSGQEFLKLARDGIEFCPDIVVSLSGVNDIEGIGTNVEGVNLLHKYFFRVWKNIIGHAEVIPDSLHLRNMDKLTAGLERKRTDVEYWINNQRKMYAVCKEFNIKFIGLLQPMIFYQNLIEEDLLNLIVDSGITDNYMSQQKRFIEEIKKLIVNYQWITDLTSLFVNQTEMYYDSVHYSEKGNSLIAKEVAGLIIRSIQK